MVVSLKKMNLEHLDQVVEIESDSFDVPWSRVSFQQEMSLEFAVAFVAVRRWREHERIVGYITAWIVNDECTINRIACERAYRRQRLGSRLLHYLIQQAVDRDAGTMLLEVRKSNIIAREFYGRNGFAEGGERRGYYERPREDAVIMVRDLLKVLPANE